MVGYDLDFTIDCIINSRQSHHDFHLFEFSSFLLSLNAIGLLFLFFLNQWRRSLLVIRENAGLRLLTFQTREAPSAYYTVYGLHVSKFAPQYTPTELQSGFSRLVMNGQWHLAPHSDKSLPNDTEKRGPRSDHPSDVLRSSASVGGSHPHHAMRGFTCPLPILNSLSIFFYKSPLALAPFVSLLLSTAILPFTSACNSPFT